MRKWWSDLDGFFKFLIILGLIVLPPLGFYVHCLNHVSINEVGVAYNSLDGTVEKQEQPGWYLTSPFIQVAYVPQLPFVVTIPSSAKVILSKVVRFNLGGLDEYIRLQGWSYQMESDIQNSFLGYAFSGQPFPFLVIVQEAAAETFGNLRPGPTTDRQP